MTQILNNFNNFLFYNVLPILIKLIIVLIIIDIVIVVLRYSLKLINMFLAHWLDVKEKKEHDSQDPKK